jgi:hypothetical protein
MSVLAYDLFHDASHIKGTVYDANLVPFEGDVYVCGWIGAERLQVPEPILFEADFKVTRRSDFPCNDVGWPIMSPRMIQILREVRDFPHRLVPVRFVDRSVRGPARYLPDGSMRSEVFDDRFAVVQLTEYINVVDWERSVFRRRRSNPNGVWFDKLVLLEPPGGLPPLFRIESQSSLLLVSAEARRALEAAGIRGVRFEELPDRRVVDTSDTSQAS